MVGLKPVLYTIAVAVLIECSMPDRPKTKARILVYVSSALEIPLREGGRYRTGVFLGELTEPLEKLVAQGHELQFVSPDGRGPHIDPQSARLLYWRFSQKRRDAAQRFLVELKRSGINDPLKLENFMRVPGELDDCDALFIPGGHA